VILQGNDWTSAKKLATTEKFLYVLEQTDVIVSAHLLVAKYKGTPSAYSFGNKKLLGS